MLNVSTTKETQNLVTELTKMMNPFKVSTRKSVENIIHSFGASPWFVAEN